MKLWLKFSISAIFLLSAFGKVLDFENTVVYFYEISQLGFETTKSMLALFIFIEMIIAFTLPIKWRGRRIIQGATLLILTFFLGLSLTFVFSGVENCGCFGTNWTSHPWLTVMKNLVLIGMTAALRYDFGAHKYA